MTQSEWAEVPEHDKEKVLHAQRFDKWNIAVFKMYLHFNKDRVRTMREMEGMIGYDMVRQDFETRRQTAKKKIRDPERPAPLDFYAAVCGVHKSSISRYMRGHDRGFIDKDTNEFIQISQNRALRFRHQKVIVKLFNECRDSNGDFASICDVILEGHMMVNTKKELIFALSLWLEGQPDEVYGRVNNDCFKGWQHGV